MLRPIEFGASSQNYKFSWKNNKNSSTKFKWESPEGDSDISQREAAQKRNIVSHSILITECARQICVSQVATRRWNQANRSGGPVTAHG